MMSNSRTEAWMHHRHHDTAVLWHAVRPAGCNNQFSHTFPQMLWCSRASNTERVKRGRMQKWLEVNSVCERGRHAQKSRTRNKIRRMPSLFYSATSPIRSASPWESSWVAVQLQADWSHLLSAPGLYSNCECPRVSKDFVGNSCRKGETVKS